MFLVRGGKSRGKVKPFNDAMSDPTSLKTRLEICGCEFFIENCSEIIEIAEIAEILVIDIRILIDILKIYFDNYNS